MKYVQGSIVNFHSNNVHFIGYVWYIWKDPWIDLIVKHNLKIAKVKYGRLYGQYCAYSRLCMMHFCYMKFHNIWETKEHKINHFKSPLLLFPVFPQYCFARNQLNISLHTFHVRCTAKKWDFPRIILPTASINSLQLTQLIIERSIGSYNYSYINRCPTRAFLGLILIGCDEKVVIQK